MRLAGLTRPIFRQHPTVRPPGQRWCVRGRGDLHTGQCSL